MFGRSIKKYRQIAMQLIDDSIAELLPSYISLVSSRVFDLDDEYDDIRNSYDYDVYNLSLDKIQESLGGEIADRIGYLRYKASNTEIENAETIGSAYLYMLNAMTGRKANNDEKMQANKLSVNFIIYFKQVVRQATMDACELTAEEKDSPNLLASQKAMAKLCYTSKYSLEDAVTEKELEEMLFSNKISDDEYNNFIEQRNMLEMSLTESKRQLEEMKRDSEIGQPAKSTMESDENTLSPIDEALYHTAREFISKEIDFTNSLIDSDFVNTDEINCYPLFCIIHGITCFYIYSCFTNELPLLNFSDSIARDVLSNAGINKDGCDTLLKLSDDVYSNLLDLAKQFESHIAPENNEQRFVACAGIALNRELGYNEQNQFVDFQIMKLFVDLEGVRDSDVEEIQ